MPAAKYVMPLARVGFAVWYPDKHDLSEPIPCIITKIGLGSVSLTMWAEDNRGGIPKDGVMHLSDPEIDVRAGYTAGVWDYAPAEKILNAMVKEHAEFKATLALLVEAMGGDIKPAYPEP